ncbi:MAG: hypothetical protein QOI64_1816 [Solirubrobacteraceae bacterium]|nr:hypothetical protein [Solirubrobacteraceae bacterium]
MWESRCERILRRRRSFSIDMRPFLAIALLVVVAAVAPAVAAPKRSFEGRACTPPKGHRIADCRIGRHGTPDLSRAAWRALRGAEVTISERFDALAPNPAAGGARSWPLIDSLAQPMGRLETDEAGRFRLLALDGTAYRATTVNVRGHGCAVGAEQSNRFPLVQIIAGKADGGGTQAFLDSAAIDRSTPLGAVAFDAFARQRGGGTGCGPSGREVGKVRRLADPNVDPAAHARLSNGAINDVKEYDAKPDFGNIVYFMTNTTSVSVGGVARGMVRVGTPIAKVDSFDYCDPNSDGTLTWRYWSIPTGVTTRPRLYGWIPGRCPKR